MRVIKVHDNPLKEPKLALTDEAVPNDRLKEIVARWGDVEMLLEQHSRKSELVEEMKTYLDDLKKELCWVKWFRGIIVFIMITYIIFINALLICIFFYKTSIVTTIGPYPTTALIVLILSTTAVLLGKTITGLFKTYGERNKDEFIPPHLKQLVEALKLVSN